MLQFFIGASIALGGDVLKDAFGAVAMVAMMPLITIQTVGIFYTIRDRKRRSTPLPNSAITILLSFGRECRMNFVISICNPDNVNILKEICHELSLPINVILRGRGTAVRSMLDLLGLESNEKRVLTLGCG